MTSRWTSAGLRAGLVLLAFGLGLTHADPAAAAASGVKTAALKTDADGDGQISPGDTITYSIAISGTDSSVIFADPVPDSNTSLVVGSVTTTQGSVIQGNTGGDTSVGVNIGSLNGTVTVKFDVTIINPLPSSVVPAQVFNVGGISCSGCGAGTQVGPLFTPLNAAPNLTIAKTVVRQVDADASGTTSPGDTLRYTVKITNSGNQNAAAVFADSIPDANLSLVVGSVTTTQGSITMGNTAGNTVVAVNLGDVAAAGGMATITFDATIKNPLSALTVNQVGNQGGVHCDDCSPQDQGTDDPNTAAANDPTITPVVAAPILTITKTVVRQVDADASGTTSPGDTLRYTVTITNSGNQNATTAFADSIPDANLALVVGSVTTTQGSITTGNTAGDTVVAVNVGTVAGGGGVATITFDVTIKNPLSALAVNQVGNQGGVHCDDCTPQDQGTDDPNTATANDPTITPVVAAPNLTITKTAVRQVDADASGTTSPGDTLRYTVTITNSGNQDAATAFADSIPDANLALVVGSVTTTTGSVTTGNTAGDTVVAVNVGTVAGGGGVATITFDVTIKNPLPAFVNQIGNQGGVHCGDCTPQDQGTDDPSTMAANDPTITAVVASPILTVTKTAVRQIDADGDGQTSPGDTLRYTITITNSGNQDASASFIDPIPDSNTTLVAGSVVTSQGTVNTGNTAGDTSVVVTLGSVVGGGGVATITFDVTIKNPFPAFVMQVADQGGVQCGNCTPQSQATDDPNTGTANDPTITQIVTMPNVTATKTVALAIDVNHNGQIDAGDTLKYTVVITNSGNQNAAGLVFFDFGSAKTTLVVPSTTTTLGTVITGNTPGDIAVVVQIPTLVGGGGSATIMYARQIKTSLIGHVPISNQGTISGQNFPTTVTDDPNTPAPNDPTTVIAFGPTPAPVMSDLGLLFLVALLAGVAVLGLRRASMGRYSA